MEELRQKLIKSIEENGRESLVTIQTSQELDKLIVEEQLRMMRCRGVC
ncbi:aspartyl-phosphate phosphatase Spo0E family protein [Candidatus Clostridium helianthi]|uniref:Aspartyl-phosphate phosphatase Spo0E family protein n=1 Tax=Candidatus Clostridium helianthi TaxID=3381660 RepID=A0ABW8S2X0_9CLOT